MQKGLEQIVSGLRNIYNLPSRKNLKGELRKRILDRRVSDPGFKGKTLSDVVSQYDLSGVFDKHLGDYLESSKGNAAYALYWISNVKNKLTKAAEATELSVSVANPLVTIPVQAAANTFEVPIYFIADTAYDLARLALGVKSGMIKPDLKGIGGYLKDVITGYIYAAGRLIPVLGSLGTMLEYHEDPVPKLAESIGSDIEKKLLGEIKKVKGSASAEETEFLSETPRKKGKGSTPAEYSGKPNDSYFGDRFRNDYPTLENAA